MNAVAFPRLFGRIYLSILRFRRISIMAVLSVFICSGYSVAGEFSRTDYNGAKVCSYCHSDIYDSWKSSIHSRAYTDNAFMTAFKDVYYDTRGKAKGICLRCHAPTVYETGDVDVLLPVTKEGVTCDFCHTIEDVNLENHTAPYKLDPGGEKRASMKVIDIKRYVETSAAHETSYAKWFNKSELCAGCHEVTNVEGFKIGETYTEWKASSYARDGVQCQDCHMGRIPGSTHVPSIKAPIKDTIPDHSLSHELAKMKGAVELEIVKMEPADNMRYMVDVAMTNAKAGHNIPTGYPTRKLTLEVRVKGDGGSGMTQIKTFGKWVADKDGETLSSDVDVQMKAVKTIQNTALGPGERRVVRFIFGSTPKGKVSVSASAFLTHRTEMKSAEHVHIPLFSVEK